MLLQASLHCSVLVVTLLGFGRQRVVAWRLGARVTARLLYQRLGQVRPDGKVSHDRGVEGSREADGGRLGRAALAGGRQSAPTSRPGHADRVRGVVRRGGVRLLHRQVAVVAAPVQTLRVSPTALEIFLKHETVKITGGLAIPHLVDTVAERVRYPAHDGPPHLAGRHLPQLDGRGFAVERGVRRHDQVGSFLQWRIACRGKGLVSMDWKVVETCIEKQLQATTNPPDRPGQPTKEDKLLTNGLNALAMDAEYLARCGSRKTDLEDYKGSMESVVRNCTDL